MRIRNVVVCTPIRTQEIPPSCSQRIESERLVRRKWGKGSLKRRDGRTLVFGLVVVGLGLALVGAEVGVAGPGADVEPLAQHHPAPQPQRVAAGAVRAAAQQHRLRPAPHHPLRSTNKKPPISSAIYHKLSSSIAAEIAKNQYLLLPTPAVAPSGRVVPVLVILPRSEQRSRRGGGGGGRHCRRVRRWTTTTYCRAGSSWLLRRIIWILKW